jgi:mRNA interferase MazF
MRCARARMIDRFRPRRLTHLRLRLQLSGTITKTTFTMPSEALAFGAIVLVPFPFTDQSASKQRPAVIVSSAQYAHERSDVILMAVTSQLHPSPAFGEVWITDWRGAGLLKPSAIKPVIATLEQRLIRRKLGALAKADCDTLAAALSQILRVA